MLGMFRKRNAQQHTPPPLPNKERLCENCRYFDLISVEDAILTKDKQVTKRCLGAAWCARGDFQLFNNAPCDLFQPFYTAEECIRAEKDWYPQGKRTEGAWDFIRAWRAEGLAPKEE